MNTQEKINYGTLGSNGSSYAVYTDKYDPSLLVPIERRIIRDQWGISSLFEGDDVWTCHEATFLTQKGRPISGTLRFFYSAHTPYIVESKSMKLYLNSFDMCKMGVDHNDAAYNYVEQIKKDLSAIVKGDVHAHFISSEDYQDQLSSTLDDPLKHYISIETEFSQRELDSLVFDDYEGKSLHLKLSKPPNTGDARYYTNVLRSRCRHTKQKDTGTAVYAHLGPLNKIDPLSFLKQVVSMREVNEFHEGCCEKLFSDCMEFVSSKQGFIVALLYSRRGSLDINPIRYVPWLKESTGSLDSIFYMTDVTRMPMKAQGQ